MTNVLFAIAALQEAARSAPPINSEAIGRRARRLSWEIHQGGAQAAESAEEATRMLAGWLTTASPDDLERLALCMRSRPLAPAHDYGGAIAPSPVHPRAYAASKMGLAALQRLSKGNPVGHVITEEEIALEVRRMTREERRKILFTYLGPVAVDERDEIADDERRRTAEMYRVDELTKEFFPKP